MATIHTRQLQQYTQDNYNDIWNDDLKLEMLNLCLLDRALLR